MPASVPLIVAAPDSFKGSCSAADAARAMLAGARAVYGDRAEYLAIPLADGGEGTLDALAGVWGVDPIHTPARDALGRPRNARYAMSADGGTAIIEAAEANGLPWVSDVPLRPLEADSAGVGDIVRDALGRGVSEILLCVGGSATSDGGTGLLRELGVQFLDTSDREVEHGASGLTSIVRVDASGLDPRAKQARWRIAVDVRSPLCGPEGAAAVYGPQKGATADCVRLIDEGLANLAGVLAADRGLPTTDYTERPGFGAAGGIPLAAVALLGAEVVSGADLVSEAIGLPELLARASLVLTGEGRFDEQSLQGKVVSMVAWARPHDVPLVVIAGTVDLSPEATQAAGVSAAFSIAHGPASLEELVGNAEASITQVAAQVCGLVDPHPAH